MLGSPTSSRYRSARSTAFKREHDLAPAEASGGDAEPGLACDEEPDLRAEDDALVAAPWTPSRRRRSEDEAPTDASDDGDGDEATASRASAAGRGAAAARRGGARIEPLEGTFDHGEEGYGLWLDPAIQDNAVYAEHWAGHRPLTVTVEPDRIVIEPRARRRTARRRRGLGDEASIEDDFAAARG